MPNLTVLENVGSVEMNYLEALDFGSTVLVEYEEDILKLDPAFRSEPFLYSSKSSHFKENRFRSATVAPLLLAEVFGISDRTLLRNAVLANLYLDHFTHLVDDSADVNQELGPTQIHLASLLLAKGISLYSILSGASVELLDKIGSYLKKASAAERFLWRHHGTIIPYDEVDYSKVAERSSLVKAGPALYCAITLKWEFLSQIESALDAVSVGIQLADDLIDWKDDLRCKIYTLPIVAAHSSCGSLHEPDLERALVIGKAASLVLETSRKYLLRGKAGFEKLGARSIVSLLENQIADISALNQRLASCGDTPSIDSRVVSDWSNLIRKMLVTRMEH